MRRILFVAIILAVASGFAAAQVKIAATLYKNPSCMCCDRYANYLRENEYNVTVVEHPNMTMIKQKYGVREDLEGCHTTVVGNYIAEGHVPIASIIAAPRGKACRSRDISLPGMPQGSRLPMAGPAFVSPLHRPVIHEKIPAPIIRANTKSKNAPNSIRCVSKARRRASSALGLRFPLLRPEALLWIF